MLFDEATASLDAESELFVQEALLYVSIGKALIIVANRLANVKNDDKI
jgi:ATP-binding cassette subfamily B protein AbcA/BmrA